MTSISLVTSNLTLVCLLGSNQFLKIYQKQAKLVYLRQIETDEGIPKAGEKIIISLKDCGRALYSFVFLICVESKAGGIRYVWLVYRIQV